MRISYRGYYARLPPWSHEFESRYPLAMNDRTCDFCGEQTTNPRFCNLTCANRYNAKNKRDKAVKRNTRPCRECGKMFYRKDSRILSCSRSCGIAYSNRVNPKRKKLSISHQCAAVNCTNTAERIRGDIYLCSKECRYAYNVHEWLEGRESGSNKYTYKAFVKQYLLETYGYRCVLCDICEHRPEVVEVLQLDHIDGHWDNNSPDNVRMLCPTCHALTETYGAKNKGQGRTWKSKYDQYSPVDRVDRSDRGVVE